MKKLTFNDIIEFNKLSYKIHKLHLYTCMFNPRNPQCKYLLRSFCKNKKKSRVHWRESRIVVGKQAERPT